MKVKRWLFVIFPSHFMCVWWCEAVVWNSSCVWWTETGLWGREAALKLSKTTSHYWQPGQIISYADQPSVLIKHTQTNKLTLISILIVIRNESEVMCATRGHTTYSSSKMHWDSTSTLRNVWMLLSLNTKIWKWTNDFSP